MHVMANLPPRHSVLPLLLQLAAPRRPAGARLPRSAHRPAAPRAAQAPVDHLHPVEDDLRGGLGLRASRILDALEAQRLTELHRHLGELKPLPVAHSFGACYRGRQHRRPGLEREAPDPVARLSQLSRARAAGLRVHDDDAAALEDGVSGDERLLRPLKSCDLAMKCTLRRMYTATKKWSR